MQHLNSLSALHPLSTWSGCLLKLLSDYYQWRLCWPSLCQFLIWSCPAAWLPSAGQASQGACRCCPPPTQLLLLHRSLGHVKEEYRIQSINQLLLSNTFSSISVFHLPELPCTLSLSRHQRQSSSHVQLPPKQHQHFTICHRSAHPIRQRSWRGHGYVHVLTV